MALIGIGEILFACCLLSLLYILIKPQLVNTHWFTINFHPTIINQGGNLWCLTWVTRRALFGQVNDAQMSLAQWVSLVL